MKFSTGRHTKMGHATGIDMRKLAEIKRRVKALKHSSGEGGPLKHSTGKEFDYKLIYEEVLEEERLKQEEKE